jgi:hypothetical protein
MDPVGLSLEVHIYGADDDPGMVRLLHMQSHEVAAIPCENRPTVGRSDSENLRIDGTSVRPPRLASRHAIVSEPTQAQDDLVREVFVGE